MFAESVFVCLAHKMHQRQTMHLHFAAPEIFRHNSLKCVIYACMYCIVSTHFWQTRRNFDKQLEFYSLLPTYVLQYPMGTKENVFSF